MKGFTILEVLIATAIASFLSIALFMALRQSMGYQSTVDYLVDANARAAIFQNQFEQDFMGFFVPSQAYELVSTKTVGNGSKKQPEQIDKIFYAAKGKEQFGMLSFITTHAMQVYWGATMGAPKPLVTRVAYKLVPANSTSHTGHPERVEGRRVGENSQNDSFVLTRQESGNLDYAPFESSGEKQKIRAYEIVSDVKSMKVTYVARVYRSEDKKGSSSASERTGEKKNSANLNEGKSNPTVRPEALEGHSSKNAKLPSWIYREFTEWDWSPKSSSAKATKDASKDAKVKEKGKDTKPKETVSRVPLYIKVDLVLWDAEHTRETPFSFVFARKPFEMIELEKDTPPQKEKPAPAMPDIRPVLDMLKIPGVGPQAKAPQTSVQTMPALPRMKSNPMLAKINDVQKP